jgi:hypothetical protein
MFAFSLGMVLMGRTPRPKRCTAVARALTVGPIHWRTFSITALQAKSP